ncbi:MAG: FIST C-terminal domain-containing protein [Phycisphaerales bacterium]|nr:FIST C-terminal domain-containing protein [Phycisphaerales bacterium]
MRTTTVNADDNAVIVSATTEHHDTRTAADEIASAVHDGMNGRSPDLVMLMASFHHAAALPDACNDLRRMIVPGHLLAATAESVLGDDRELEGLAGMSALAMRFRTEHQRIRMTPWRTTPWDPVPLSQPDALAARIDAASDTQGVIMFADPFSTPSSRMLPAIGGCLGGTHFIPVTGGLLSGASQPSCNRLILDDVVQDAGAIGLTISGDLQVDTVVSQGCRPVGPTIVVTNCDQNVLTGLNGRPALDTIHDVLAELPDQERELLSGGLLIGRALDAGKKRLGRGDFVVRNVLGIDKEKKAIAVSELPRIGQTIQVHLRDAQAAHEDLQLLLDGQQLHDPPLAALVTTCNSRGEQLFGGVGHDTAIIRGRLESPPLAGFFAAGEFGPLGGTNIIHGHTVVTTLFRLPN